MGVHERREDDFPRQRDLVGRRALGKGRGDASPRKEEVPAGGPTRVEDEGAPEGRWRRARPRHGPFRAREQTQRAQTGFVATSRDRRNALAPAESRTAARLPSSRTFPRGG